jgi:hypothetical protein
MYSSLAPVAGREGAFFAFSIFPGLRTAAARGGAGAHFPLKHGRVDRTGKLLPWLTLGTLARRSES